MGPVAQALADLEEKKVYELVDQKIQDGEDPLKVVSELNEGMIKVGELFSENKYFISQLLFSATILKEAMARLEPLLGSVDQGNSSGIVVIGTVKGDIHDIGKNLVVTLLKGSGFEVIDLGVDVPPERFVDAVKEWGTTVVGLSALLNLTYPEMKTVVDAFKQAGLRDRVKIIIGGAPCDDKVREFSGADYLAADAISGVNIRRFAHDADVAITRWQATWEGRFMLIIGERINATRQSIRQAIESRDMDAIVREARTQIEAEAQYLDVNCGTVGAVEEPEVMQWLVRGLQQATSTPLCIDSANPDALAAGLAAHQGPAMFNSISGESERFTRVVPLIREYRTDVVALCVDDKGIPPDSVTAEKVSRDLVLRLLDAGVPANRIYVDPLVRSVATNPETVPGTLALMESLGSSFDGLHFISGLSNVSFGLPERRHLNRAYVVMTITSGLDAVIMDPLDQTLLALT